MPEQKSDPMVELGELIENQLIDAKIEALRKAIAGLEAQIGELEALKRR